MIDIAALAALTLVARLVCLLMTWGEARAHSQMLRAVARVKHEHRSHTPGGSDVAPDIPQASAATRAGVEPPVVVDRTAPPAPQILVGAVSPPQQAAPTRSRVLLSPRISGERRVIPPTSSALAGLQAWRPR